MKIKILTAGKGAELIMRYLNEEDPFTDYDFELYDDIAKGGVMGYPIVGGLSDADIKKGDYVIIGTSTHMALRRNLFDKYRDKATFITINRSNLDSGRVGQGNIIFPNVSFDYDSTIGGNNVISAGTVITHHCKIGDSNLFGPGCLLSGSVVIGNNCTFGSGIVFEPNVKIADGVTIPSGAVVVGDVSRPIKAKRLGGILTGEYVHSR
jgi:NDP-sugar pyrophosphorylase family protein